MISRFRQGRSPPPRQQHAMNVQALMIAVVMMEMRVHMLGMLITRGIALLLAL